MYHAGWRWGEGASVTTEAGTRMGIEDHWFARQMKKYLVPDILTFRPFAFFAQNVRRFLVRLQYLNLTILRLSFYYVFIILDRCAGGALCALVAQIQPWPAISHMGHGLLGG